MIPSRPVLKALSTLLFALLGVLALSAQEQDIAAIRKRADAGEAKAQYLLGAAYHSGRDIPKDLPESVRWWRKAAGQGYAPAQYLLGLTYYKGDGVARNDAESVRWWLKAADQGLNESQGMLGASYALGEGVPQDWGESYFWLSLASVGAAAERAAGVSSEADQSEINGLRDDAGSHLNDIQKAMVSDRVQQWLKAHESTPSQR